MAAHNMHMYDIVFISRSLGKRIFGKIRKFMEKENRFPLLTVVIPVYNGGDYIKNTTKNILHSDYPQIELLLVDDGSVDETPFLCKELAETEPRIRYLRQENNGIAAARNKGLRFAKGEYICFCDQDDYVEPFMYSELISHMQKESAPMGMCSTGRLINGKKSGYEFLEDGCYRREEITENILYPLLFRGYEYPFIHSGNYLYGTIWKCIYDRKFLLQNDMEFRSFVNFEDDWLFVTETLTLIDALVTNSHIGYYWHVNAASRSHIRHCIPDITDRFEKMDHYVMNCLAGRVCKEYILQEYRKISLCSHYEEGYRNAVCANTGRERRRCREKLIQYLLDTDYKKQLGTLKYLKGNVFRRRFLYSSLKYLGPWVTFFINRILLFMEEYGNRMQWLAVLERKAKRKG